MRIQRTPAVGILGIVLLAACDGGGTESNASNANAYSQTTFVATKATQFSPSLTEGAAVDPQFVDAWGIALRPAGQPGHFWVVAGNKSYEYTGGVSGRLIQPCTIVSGLCADLAPLRDASGKPSNVVTFPDFPVDAGGQPDVANSHGTAVVFNDQAQRRAQGLPASFVITQSFNRSYGDHAAVTITSNARFFFATDYGAIYAWTEVRNPTNGTMFDQFDRSSTALKVFDPRPTNDGAQIFGLAINANADRLYATDFGNFKVRIFGSTLTNNTSLQEITGTLNGGNAFANPFAADPAHPKGGEFVPYNVQAIGSSIFVTYAQVNDDGNGNAVPGDEVHAPGAGKLVEFDPDGRLIAIWDDRGLLNAPWGVTVAPGNFGALSNTLLVGNFGDYDQAAPLGSIVAFDRGTRRAVNYVRDAKGVPLIVNGIWGMVFGNGDEIGDSNALYFAAGPNNEVDGQFGVIRYAP